MLPYVHQLFADLDYIHKCSFIVGSCWLVVHRSTKLSYISTQLFFSPNLNLEQCAGKYTVTGDYENADAQELSVKSGDVVRLVKEEDDGHWWEYSHTAAYEEGTQCCLVVLWRFVCVCLPPCRFVRNLSSSKEGLIAAANLITLIGKSKSCQSLTSSGTETNRPKEWNRKVGIC